MPQSAIMYLLASIAHDHEMPESISAWSRLESTGGPDIRVQIDPSHTEVVNTLALLTNRRLLSMAMLSTRPTIDRYWLAYEFHDKVVTDRTVDVGILDEMGWAAQPINDYLVWVPPPSNRQSPEQFAQFAADIAGSTPRSITVKASQDLADDTLFGEFASTRRGGSSALMALSGATPGEGSVVLRNPAGLDLDISSSSGSLSYLAERGAVSVSCVGASSDTSGSQLELDGFPDAEAARKHWLNQERRASGFWIIIQVQALVDPPVGIPPGHVFEQRSVNGVQTLAATTAQSYVVNPGPPLTAAIPAWCLNAKLGLPNGQQLRLTPLRARYTEDMSQADVWRDRDRVLSTEKP